MGGADRSDVYEYSQREHEVWHLATVSKKGAAQRSADLSDACRPITKQTQSARQPTIRTTQYATQCNTMFTRLTNAVRRNTKLSHPATVPKKGATQRAVDLSDACRPITKQTQSARSTNDSHDSKCNTMQHNATQMLLVTTNAVRRSNRRSIPRLSQERAQPNRQRTSRTPAAPLRSKPNLPGNQRFARFKMQHNATQCNTMLLITTNAVRRSNRRSIPRLSQERAQ